MSIYYLNKNNCQLGFQGGLDIIFLEKNFNKKVLKYKNIFYNYSIFKISFNLAEIIKIQSNGYRIYIDIMTGEKLFSI